MVFKGPLSLSLFRLFSWISIREQWHSDSFTQLFLDVYASKALLWVLLSLVEHKEFLIRETNHASLFSFFQFISMIL